MQNVVRFISVAMLWHAAAFSFAVFAQSQAQNQLNASDVRKLIIGNTVEAHTPFGNQFRAFFDPSGKWVQQQGGQINEGTWRINDDGSQCVTSASGLSCAFIQKNDDGTYTRIVDGRPEIRWMKIFVGKAF